MIVILLYFPFQKHFPNGARLSGPENICMGWRKRPNCKSLYYLKEMGEKVTYLPSREKTGTNYYVDYASCLRVKLSGMFLATSEPAWLVLSKAERVALQKVALRQVKNKILSRFCLNKAKLEDLIVLLGDNVNFRVGACVIPCRVKLMKTKMRRRKWTMTNANAVRFNLTRDLIYAIIKSTREDPVFTPDKCGTKANFDFPNECENLKLTKKEQKRAKVLASPAVSYTHLTLPTTPYV